MTHKEALDILSGLGISARKRWGQNFLCDESVVEQIVEAARISPGSSVLEIGPGIGAVTDKLVQTAAQTLAIEIDPVLAGYLNDRFSDNETCRILNRDFLDVQPSTVIENIGMPGTVISNLPYNQMTPIIYKLIEDYPDADTMVFMVEEDACDRIFASPSTKYYGALSVITSAYGKKEKLFNVPSNCFYPSPHTNSTVVRFSGNEGQRALVPGYVNFVREAMSLRRKTLLNVMNSNPDRVMNSEKTKAFLENRGFQITVRAETLTASDFAELFELLRTDI